MKRIISLLLTLVLLTSLCACGTEPDPTTVPTTEAPASTLPESTVPETTVPETTLPPEASVPPTETQPTLPESLGAHFDNMDYTELQYWFYDFYRDYWMDYFPNFPLSDGPSPDSGEYLYWAFCMNLGNWEEGENYGKMSRTYVEETVQTYFGITPGDHRSHFKSWSYDESTELYTSYPESLKDQSYCLLHSIEYADGIYTVHATRYHWTYGYPTEEDNARLKAALFAGDFTELVEYAEITVSFRLDEETGEPTFCGYAEDSLLS